MQLFFQEALLLNPAFYSFQKPEGLIRLLRAFALKPGETPRARTCQVIQTDMGNSMGKLNSVQTISEFRISFFQLAYLDRNALWNET